MEIIFISGCGRPKLMLPLVLKGSGEQMSVFCMFSLVGYGCTKPQISVLT